MYFLLSVKPLFLHIKVDSGQKLLQESNEILWPSGKSNERKLSIYKATLEYWNGKYHLKQLFPADIIEKLL